VAIDFTTIEAWTKSGLVTFELLCVMELKTRRFWSGGNGICIRIIKPSRRVRPDAYYDRATRNIGTHFDQNRTATVSVSKHRFDDCVSDPRLIDKYQIVFCGVIATVSTFIRLL